MLINISCNCVTNHNKVIQVGTTQVDDPSKSHAFILVYYCYRTTVSLYNVMQIFTPSGATFFAFRQIFNSFDTSKTITHRINCIIKRGGNVAAVGKATDDADIGAVFVDTIAAT